MPCLPINEYRTPLAYGVDGTRYLSYSEILICANLRMIYRYQEYDLLV